MRGVFAAALAQMLGGCFVISASEVDEHDDLGGLWEGDYTTAAGATGAMALSIADARGKLSGEGALDDRVAVYIGALRGWRTQDEVYVQFEGEEPHWFEVRLAGPVDRRVLEGRCELAGFDPEALGEFVLHRSR